MCAPVGAGAPAPTFEIVFESDRDGDADLWLVKSDGTRERPLTRTDTPEGAPSWSPDGTTVVYACSPDGNWDLCEIDVKTRDMTQLTRTAVDEFDPRYTADGRQIVLETYPAARQADIAIMPDEGGVPKRLTSTRTVDDQDPAPDPRSTRIAFESDANIVVMDTRDPASTVPATRGSRGDSDPSFSSTDEIAFSGRRGGSLDILVAGPAGTSKRRAVRRLTRSAANDVEPAWTADATELFFARAARGTRGFRIVRMSADGAGLRAVTKGGAYDDTSPAPQPVAGGPGLRRALRLDVRAASATCDTVYIGNKKKNEQQGNGAKNCMFGRGNDDVLRGGGGRDQLTGDSGSDSLYGEGGDDRINAHDGKKDAVIDGGDGPDWARIDAGKDTPVYVTTVVP